MKRLQTREEVLSDFMTERDWQFVITALFDRGLITRKARDFARKRIHLREHVFSDTVGTVCNLCPSGAWDGVDGSPEAQARPEFRVSKVLLMAITGRMMGRHA